MSPLCNLFNCTATDYYTAIRWLVHWPLMGGLLHLVQWGGAWAGWGSPSPLLAVPNVTPHQSTAVYQLHIIWYCVSGQLSDPAFSAPPLFRRHCERLAKRLAKHQSPLHCLRRQLMLSYNSNGRRNRSRLMSLISDLFGIVRWSSDQQQSSFCYWAYSSHVRSFDIILTRVLSSFQRCVKQCCMEANNRLHSCVCVFIVNWNVIFTARCYARAVYAVCDGEKNWNICLFVLTWSTNVKKSPFSRTAAHIFVSPGDAPATVTQYVAWMERQFNACQIPLSMYLSIFNSFRVIRVNA